VLHDAQVGEGVGFAEPVAGWRLQLGPGPPAGGGCRIVPVRCWHHTSSLST
jgi:hypothetical protein